MDTSNIVKTCGRIHMVPFQIGVGILTGIAIGCFVLRMIVRIKYQKRILLDDAFLIFAILCLCPATGILYHICYFLYLHAAASLCPQAIQEALKHYNDLLRLQQETYAYLALIWTATFSVKLCFLAFMRPMVRHLTATNRYYWFIVGFTIISWAFCIVEPFANCPHFGKDAIKCFTSSTIVSLPIILLRHTTLSKSTRFGLTTFLCLSIFMAICAVIRIACINYRGGEDDVWEFFWQHVEGAVAVMMASITMFRTLFVPHRAPSDTKVSRSPAERLFQRFSRRFRGLAEAQPDKEVTSSTDAGLLLKLPKLPSPTFTGIRTFINKSNGTGVKPVTHDTLSSPIDDFEMDYHAGLKQQASAGRLKKPASVAGDSHARAQSLDYV
ncbi:hypothetical protein K461DRAFT_266730 [Myriangium duriaei CBS 260.36]|uniref:Rhodopsin domain-containing protein n=1 Tax=Myriangium duriaei CBS 260.36 TaxID=1168546 RepID=A0A9P4MJQ1_9PEZI|nr:hypothetical protein K461DRAFT_266730 [Myriangium duriaei CBS 260.36]